MFAFGIGTCPACQKWHPAVVDETDGVARLAIEGRCGHCGKTSMVKLDRLGRAPTAEEASACIKAWLAENLPASG